MSGQTPEFSFLPVAGNEFQMTKTLPSGEVQQLVLAAVDILEMARRLPPFVQQILAHRDPKLANLPGLENAILGEVASSKIGVDVYKMLIGMSLTDTQGMTMNYALSSESARDIGSKLLAEVDKLVGASRARQ